MSDKINGFLVTLRSEVSEDYFNKIKSAIECFDHVINVSPVVNDLNFHLAEMRVKNDYRNKLFDVLK